MTLSAEKLREMREKAKAIPSGNINSDLDVLESLYRHSPLYFEFCVSRFEYLASKPETIKKLKQLVSNGEDQERYLPLFDIAVKHMPPTEAADWVFELLTGKLKLPIASTLFMHPNFQRFGKILCEKLFEYVPEPAKRPLILFRDDVLFQQVLANDVGFALACLRKIPVKHSPVFCNEFVVIAACLLESGCRSKELVDAIVTAALSLEDPSPIVELISAKKVRVPSVFVDWVKDVLHDPPEFDSEVVELKEQPAMLRKQMLFPPRGNTDGPRLCRKREKGKADQKEIRRRILQEEDPRLLHDYLIAYSKFVRLPEDMPFRMTLLASVASQNPDAVDQFLSEFSKISCDSSIELLVSAAKGLDLVEIQSPDAVRKVFAHVREMMLKCPRQVQVPLLTAMARAVGQDELDAEFIWRDYHSIRTVSEGMLDKESIIHYCLLALNDVDDQEVAIDLVRKLCRKDRLTVEGGLWRIPYEQNPVKDLLPSSSPSPLQQNDPLWNLVRKELQKPLDTHRMLLVATAYSLFYDMLPQDQEWLKILAEAGKAVFNLNGEPSFVDKLRRNLKHIDEHVRFASLFGLDMMIAHKLVTSQEIISDLMSVVEHDSSKSVRLLGFYGLSMFKIVGAQDFVSKLGDVGKLVKEDRVGLGYCVVSWFAELLPILQDPSRRKQFEANTFIWPFTSSVCLFLDSEYDMKPLTNDVIGLGQFIYLQREADYPELFDNMIDELVNQEVDSEQMMSALCGYVPDLAFRITQWNQDERRRKIISNCSGPDTELLVALLLHERPFHKPPQSAPQCGPRVSTSIELIKEKWREMKADELRTQLAGFSDAQITGLVDERTDFSLAVALVKQKNKEVAELLMKRGQDNEMLSRVKSSYPECDNVVRAMLSLDGDLARVGDVLVYYKIGELLSEEMTCALLPYLMAEFVNDSVDSSDSVQKIERKKPVWLAEFGQCLLALNPRFFQENEKAFRLFH